MRFLFTVILFLLVSFPGRAIQPDPEAWQNRDMARYYEKEQVVLLPSGDS